MQMRRFRRLFLRPPQMSCHIRNRVVDVIQNRNIICFASGWTYHPTSKHHVMRGLAKQNNVIWVNWHASRVPSFVWGDIKTIACKLWQIQQGPRTVSDALTVITPLQIPLPASRVAREFNAWSVERAVNQILRRLPKQPVQVWSFAPDVDHFAGRFDEELLLYYCVDAFGEFPGYNRKLVERREHDLIDKCDVVVATSPPLYESKKPLHPNVHQVRHGVDHAHLSRALWDDLPLPRDLARLRRPIYGFVGVIGDWVDLDLVAGLARRQPEASIVMIGPERQPRGACAGLKNIHWLGGRDHRMLPNYLRFFDVGLIPFKKEPLTINANPIKLHEYLAAGVPTVSTSLPAVPPIEGSVWVADTAAETAECCNDARQHNSPADRAARSKLMLAESWSQRLEELSAIIEATPKRISPAAAPSRIADQSARRPLTVPVSHRL